mmetsp:Transcript_43096/g.107923  ORF Transcript_43096/g.107923 Transcript_43096/m.107923 type:complete len:260 (+) Transcript_43096:299-1078(+)
MPKTATLAPPTCFTVYGSFRMTQPPSSTSTVFMCPSTWKVTAEKRPRQKNCETFTRTAVRQEAARKPSAGTLYSYSWTQTPEMSLSRKGPTSSSIIPCRGADFASKSWELMRNLRCKEPQKICCSALLTTDTAAHMRPTWFTSTSVTVTTPTPKSTTAMASSMGTVKVALRKTIISRKHVVGMISSLATWYVPTALIMRLTLRLTMEVLAVRTNRRSCEVGMLDCLSSFLSSPALFPQVMDAEHVRKWMALSVVAKLKP